MQPLVVPQGGAEVVGVGEGWPTPRRSGGRSSGSIDVLSHMMTARSIALSSWRTFPFHWAAMRSRIVSLLGARDPLPHRAGSGGRRSGRQAQECRRAVPAAGNTELHPIEAVEEVFLETLFADRA